MTSPHHLKLPNIRSAIIPDDGFEFVEIDLKGADAQVCAWDADCPSFKSLLQSGVDLHTNNARWIYDLPLDANVHDLHINRESYRNNAKRAVHLTDYGGGEKTLATSNSISQAKAAAFIHHWTCVQHPEIHDWQQRILYQLQSSSAPCVYNAFGYRKFYNDRITPYILFQALAWICQSTVALVAAKAMKRSFDEVCTPEYCHLLKQDHDSVLWQVLSQKLNEIIPQLQACFDIIIPYDDPLIIPIGTKVSHESLGRMKQWTAL